MKTCTYVKSDVEKTEQTQACKQNILVKTKMKSKIINKGLQGFSHNASY